MRVQSISDSLGWASAQAVRASAADLARPGSGSDRQRRSGERDRRRVEPRRAATAAAADEFAPSPCLTLAATIASLSIGTPVAAQASCHHVTAAYTEDD